MKGGRTSKVDKRIKMCSHVASYYAHLMNSVKTGCPMRDYCMKDVYVILIVRNMV